MNKSMLVVLGTIVAFFLLIGVIFMSSYNGLITKEETVKEKWANVESAYQRRANLIPNLVETVQGAVDFEQETQTQIAALRSSASQASEDMKNAENPEEFQQAAQQSEQALSAFRGLNINVEAYPQLNANENFLSLQDELAGTENRIKVERDNYNKAVKEFNVKVRRFPTNIIAGMFGFTPKESFEADEGAEEAVNVSFE